MKPLVQFIKEEIVADTRELTKLLVDSVYSKYIDRYNKNQPECGDVMKLQIKVENEKIVDAKFKTFGCGSAIASSSLATEWIKGMSIDEASSIQNTHIVKELSLPPVKIHCSVLAEDAIKGAINDYRKKNGIVR